MMRGRRVTIGLGLMFAGWAALAGSATARNRPPPEPPRIDIDEAALDWDMVTLGGGLGIVPSFEGSGDYVLLPVTGYHGRVRGLHFAGRGTRIVVDITRPLRLLPRGFHAGPAINVNYTRSYLQALDPQVRRLGRRYAATEVGGYAGYAWRDLFGDGDALGLNVAYLRDVSGIHDSAVILPSIDYARTIGRHGLLNLSVSAAFAGDRYARTYYAVDRAGALASGLPLYPDPRGGLKSIGGAAAFNRSFATPFGTRVGAYALVSYSVLQGDFARSPIVARAGSTDQVLGALGLGYTF